MNQEEIELAGRILAQAIALAVAVAVAETGLEVGMKEGPASTPASRLTVPSSFGAPRVTPLGRAEGGFLQEPLYKGGKGFGPAS